MTMPLSHHLHRLPPLALFAMKCRKLKHKHVVLGTMLLLISITFVLLGKPFGMGFKLVERMPRQQAAGTLPPPSPSVAGTWSWKFNVSRPAMETCMRKVAAQPFWQELQTTYSRCALASRLLPLQPCAWTSVQAWQQLLMC